MSDEPRTDEANASKYNDFNARLVKLETAFAQSDRSDAKWWRYVLGIVFCGIANFACIMLSALIMQKAFGFSGKLLGVLVTAGFVFSTVLSVILAVLALRIHDGGN